MYRRRKFDIEPVLGHIKRNFSIHRTHLRGQRAVKMEA
nr:transposase [Limosilactobacillus agrestimuris]